MDSVITDDINDRHNVDVSNLDIWRQNYVTMTNKSHINQIIVNKVGQPKR